jgi:hypothetical protein
MNDEKLTALREELARQDAALHHARQEIETFGDHSIDVPEEWLRAIEDACTPQVVIAAPIVFGIRA